MNHQIWRTSYKSRRCPHLFSEPCVKETDERYMMHSYSSFSVLLRLLRTGIPLNHDKPLNQVGIFANIFACGACKLFPSSWNSDKTRNSICRHSTIPEKKARSTTFPCYSLKGANAPPRALANPQGGKFGPGPLCKQLDRVLSSVVKDPLHNTIRQASYWFDQSVGSIVVPIP